VEQIIPDVLGQIVYVLLFAAIIWKQCELGNRIKQAERFIETNLENMEELVKVLKEKARKDNERLH